MTTDVVVHQGGELSEKMEWAKSLSYSDLLPPKFKGNAANLLFAVEYADALNISRINAITSIHVIEGRPSASADLIAALVRRDGHKLRVKGDDQSATVTIVRRDDPDEPTTVTWTLDRAKTAGLTNKQVWKNYPAAMLRARAITECARAACSEALLGLIYTPEELGADVDQTGAPVKATVTAEPAKAAPDRMRALLTPSEPEPAPIVQDAPWEEPPMTPQQRGRMFANFGKLEITDHEQQRRYIADVIGRPVTKGEQGRASLTMVEVEQVLAQQQAQLVEAVSS